MKDQTTVLSSVIYCDTNFITKSMYRSKSCVTTTAVWKPYQQFNLPEQYNHHNDKIKTRLRMFLQMTSDFFQATQLPGKRLNDYLGQALLLTMIHCFNNTQISKINKTLTTTTKQNNKNNTHRTKPKQNNKRKKKKRMTKKHTLHGNAEPEFWHCQQFVRLKGSHFIQIGSSSKLQTSNCSNPQLQEKTFPRNTTSPFNAMAQPPVRNESIAVSCLRENKTIPATLLHTLTSSKVAPWRHCSQQRSSLLPRCGRRRTWAAEKPDESYGNSTAGHITILQAYYITSYTQTLFATSEWTKNQL